MAEKFSDFTPVSNLEPGYEFALLLPGDNGRVTVDVLNDHIEDQVETLIGGFFVNGIGTTFNTNKYDLGGNFGANSIDLVGDNSSVHIGNDNIIFAFDNSSYTFQEAFADLKATDGADESGLGLTSLESHLYSRYDDAELYIGVNDENVLLSYINTGVNTSITLTNDIVIDAESDIIFPDFANAVLSANALGVLTPTAITYNVDKFTFSAGENVIIEDSSWSAFFGENHIINGIFNDGLVAGEDHFSEGIAGNNAIFGRNNKLTGTGTKNFNIIAGDDNEILGSGILSSNGNAVFGTGNTLQDTSNSSIISGSNITGTDDDTAYGDNLNLAGNLILQGIISASMLGTDSLGNVINVNSVLKEATFDGSVLFEIGGVGPDWSAMLLLDDSLDGNFAMRLLTGDPSYIDPHAMFWVYGGDTASIDVNDGSGNGTALKMTPTAIEFKGVGTAQAGVELDSDTYGPGYTTKSLLHKGYFNSFDIVIGNSAKGLVLKSNNGHYWRFTVSDSGILSSPGSDLGTTPP